jgi:hypothetical protein
LGQTGSQPQIPTRGERHTQKVFGAVRLDDVSFTYLHQQDYFQWETYLAFLEQVVVPAFYCRRHRIYLIQGNASYHKKQKPMTGSRPTPRRGSLPASALLAGAGCNGENLELHAQACHTQSVFLNDLRIFATRCFAGLTLCDSIRKRSKACFIPFFDIDVELFMRTYYRTVERLDSLWSHHGFPVCYSSESVVA